MLSNKISHVINCAGNDIQNHQHISRKQGLSQVQPIKYLTFYWLDDDRQLIFDEQDQVPVEIERFIDEALDSGTSVLVHS